jgi:hypothetical protein
MSIINLSNRKQSDHKASRIEREKINGQTNKSSGDYEKNTSCEKEQVNAKNSTPGFH